MWQNLWAEFFVFSDKIVHFGLTSLYFGLYFGLYLLQNL